MPLLKLFFLDFKTDWTNSENLALSIVYNKYSNKYS